MNLFKASNDIPLYEILGIKHGRIVGPVSEHLVLSVQDVRDKMMYGDFASEDTETSVYEARAYGLAEDTLALMSQISDWKPPRDFKPVYNTAVWCDKCIIPSEHCHLIKVSDLAEAGIGPNAHLLSAQDFLNKLTSLQELSLKRHPDWQLDYAVIMNQIAQRPLPLDKMEEMILCDSLPAYIQEAFEVHPWNYNRVMETVNRYRAETRAKN